jgi:hypothetical protein
LAISIPAPQLQVDFALALEKIRATYLQEALGVSVSSLDVRMIDAELGKLAPASALAELAGRGLRGELLFAVPCVLRANPRLLGYYRLLLGFSQKAFYAFSGAGLFRSMEEKGSLRPKQAASLQPLCLALAPVSAALLTGIGARRMTRDLLDDLTLLTVGPYLRGGSNVKVGMAGIVRVFDAISAIVSHAGASIEPQRIELINAARRRVIIQFASDPDIRVQEEMGPGQYRNMLAIEVKAGLDFSNIHNRIGEAEKSHQKAKADGYVERWTVVNVDRMDMVMARRETPSTDQFYRLSQIDAGVGDEYHDFYSRVISLTGVPSAPS